MALASLAVAESSQPTWWRIVLACGVIVLSQVAALRVRMRGEVVEFVWGEGALLLGLVVLPGPWLVLITACCMTFLALLPRRVPIKALFNAASATIATGAAAAVAGLFFTEGQVSRMSWQL
ncbi:MAG: hypothetical protein WCB04_08825, partial [Mycobacteriales bacterium]